MPTYVSVVGVDVLCFRWPEVPGVFVTCFAKSCCMVLIMNVYLTVFVWINFAFINVFAWVNFAYIYIFWGVYFA